MSSANLTGEKDAIIRLIVTSLSREGFFITMTKLNIPILLGTARSARESERVAHHILHETTRYGFDSALIDVRNFLAGRTIPDWSDDPEKSIWTRWKEIVLRADGIIIVSPEYNRGYPGELKIILDSLYSEYHRKPVGIVGVSDGIMGGSRMVESLRIILIELGMIPIRPVLYFPNITTQFDVTSEVTKKRMKMFCDELAWFATAMKNAKKNQTSK